jgi:hypothetical protein
MALVAVAAVGLAFLPMSDHRAVVLATTFASKVRPEQDWANVGRTAVRWNATRCWKVYFERDHDPWRPTETNFCIVMQGVSFVEVSHPRFVVLVFDDGECALQVFPRVEGVPQTSLVPDPADFLRQVVRPSENPRSLRYE